MVIGRILNRAEIQTAKFHLQYLFQFYPYNLKIMLELFTGNSKKN